jgi:predicted component of type VI protein secretion system
MEIRLLVVQGKPLGKEIPVKESRFLIGRSEECHLRPNSELVSRLHCEIRVEGNTVRLRDLGSSNGTIVNGERLGDEVFVNDGDLVQIGPLGFQVILVRDSAVANVPAASSAREQPSAVAAIAPAAASRAPVAAARSDKLGTKEASHDEIHHWLVGDNQRPVPESGSGVYDGETQMLHIAALVETTADPKPEDTPPNGVVTQVAPGDTQEAPGDEVELADGRKAKVGSNKQVIEKTREDTSRAASEILRRLMERRPGRQ